MFDETLEILTDTSAMEGLKLMAEVETEYGGGFVNAINGVRSKSIGNRGAEKDWFIYINGIQSNIGAFDYKLHHGDIEHWDYNDWSFHQFVPAIIGDFPEPFLHGYGGKVSPTMVVYATGQKKEAENLKRNLVKLGVSNADIRMFSELSESEKESSNLIILGTIGNALVSELNKVWKRLGFFAHFEGGNIVTVNSKGEVVAEYGAETGLIQATQNPWNPKGIGACENVVWLVSGTNQAGIQSAVDILLDNYSVIQYAYAVVVTGDGVIRVPHD